MTTCTTWLVPSEYRQVMDLELSAWGEHAWDETELRRTLEQENVVGIGCWLDGRLVAFVIYQSHTNYLRVLNLAVHPEYQRFGFGRSMLQKMFAKLHEDRDRLVIDVADWNLSAHCWLRACGYRAKRVLKSSAGDTYRFERRLTQEVPV